MSDEARWLCGFPLALRGKYKFFWIPFLLCIYPAYYLSGLLLDFLFPDF